MNFFKIKFTKLKQKDLNPVKIVTLLEKVRSHNLVRIKFRFHIRN